jgi:hypothetical protein
MLHGNIGQETPRIKKGAFASTHRCIYQRDDFTFMIIDPVKHAESECYSRGSPERPR